jgi:hypothetical protein
LEHNGDHSAAAKELANLGYGNSFLKSEQVELPDWIVSNDNEQPTVYIAPVGKYDTIEIEDYEGLEYEEDADDPGTIPDDLLDVPGLIGDVTRYVTETNSTPQREFAFACALSLQAHLIGRRYKTPDNIRSNIYVISLGRTGSGKNRAIEFLRDKRITNTIIGIAGTFASYQAVVSSLAMQPEILSVWDELGTKLAQIQDRKNPHLLPIIGLFTELYSASNSAFYPEIRVRQKKQNPIIEPHLSLYATGTPKEVFDAFTNRQIENGFLGRIHFFLEDKKAENKTIFNKFDIPDDIFAQIKQWIPDTDIFRESLNNVIGKDTKIVNYTEDSINVFSQYLNKWNKKISNKETLRNYLWVRTGEEAKKLALIYACSRTPESPEIDSTAAEWACRLSEHLTLRKCYLTQDNVSNTEQQSVENDIVRYVRKKEKASQTEIVRRFAQGTYGKWRELAIKNLVITGILIRTREKLKNSTKLSTFYYINNEKTMKEAQKLSF